MKEWFQGGLQYCSSTWALDHCIYEIRIKEKEEQKSFSLYFLGTVELLNPNSG